MISHENTAVGAPWYPQNLPRHFASLRAEIRPETVDRIHEHSSLGFHISMLVRLANGTDCIFSERYPDLCFPTNGRSASSLHEVAASGGPKLAAHEISLEIRGASDMRQIRAIRRLRGEFPEITAIELGTKDLVVTSADELSPRRIIRLTKLVSQVFNRKLLMRSSPHSFPLREEISETDRKVLQHFSTLAWREHSAPGNKKCGGSPHGKAKNRHVQTLVLGIDSHMAFLMQEGSVLATPKTSQHHVPTSSDHYRVTSLQGGYLAWRDTARTGLSKLTVTPESIQVLRTGHDLWITALLTPGTVPSNAKNLIPRILGAPLELRTSLIPSDSTLVRLAFAVIPAEFGLRGLVESSDRKKVLLHFDRPPNQEELTPIKSYLERATDLQVYCSTTRFCPTSPEDILVKRIIAQLPSGVGLRSIYRCQVTGDFLISTVRNIPKQVLQRMTESLGYHVSQTQTLVNVPEVVKKPSAVISSAPPIRSNLTPGLQDPIRELTVLGGAGDIGGSTLALGSEILLDHGGWPQSPRKLVDLGNTPWAKPRVVIVSHSHNDHVGNLPLLCQNVNLHKPEYPTQFIMHEATALSMWPVLCEQQRHLANQLRHDDLTNLYEQVRLMPLLYPVALSPSVTLTLYPAGHHVGSTMPLLEHKGPHGTRRVLYSGDLKSDDSDFGQGRLYPAAARVADIDALIIEGTKGITPTVSRVDQERILLEEILSTVEAGGTAVLPVLASGRAQEVLTILRRNVHLFNKIGVPIFVDGQSIYAYNDLFAYISRIYPELFKVQDRQHPGWRGLSDGVFQQAPVRANRRFKEPGAPKIVVVSGGMGFGPATDYIYGIGCDERSKIIFTCYQVPNSRGAKLLAHVANPDAEPLLKDFRAQVKVCRLSGHNSGDSTLNFIKESLKPGGTVVLVHGSTENLKALRDAIAAQGHAGKVVIAETAKTIQLW